MAEAANPVAKTCSVCGVDVSNRARVKDSQGRYVCKDCFDRAREAKAAKEPAPKAAQKSAAASSSTEGDNAFLLGIGGASAAVLGTKPCPECARVLDQHTVICTNCGYNLETGKRLRIKITKEKAPKGPKK